MDTPLALLADRIADEAHRGQMSLADPLEPYVEHPRRVARRFAAAGWELSDDDLEAGYVAALLHDVVEDAGQDRSELFGLEALRSRFGVPERVLTIVALLTHRRGDTDEVYWSQVAEHPLARLVKSADIADNRDPGRVARLQPHDASRFARKYERALAIVDPDGTLARAYGISATEPPSPPPIACTLTSAAFSDRAAAWRELLGFGLVSIEERPAGVRLQVRPSLEDRIRDLLALEAECCDWFSATLTAGDVLTVDLVAAGDGPLVLRSMFEDLASTSP